MPLIAFVDERLIKELEKKCSGKKTEDVFPEHSFVANCLKVGLTINDLKNLTYVDVMKILISFLPDKKTNSNSATQKDIDRLLG